MGMQVIVNWLCAMACRAAWLAVVCGGVATAQSPADVLFENPCTQGSPCAYEAYEVWDTTDPATQRALARAGTRSALLPVCRSTATADCGETIQVFKLKSGPTLSDRPSVEGVATHSKSVQRPSSGGGYKSTHPPTAGSPNAVGIGMHAKLPVSPVKPTIETASLAFGWQHFDGRTALRDHQFRTGDHVVLWVESDRPGLVYVVNVDSAGTIIPLTETPTQGREKVQVEVRFEGRPGVERVYAIFAPRKMPELPAYVAKLRSSFSVSDGVASEVQFAALDSQGRTSSDGVISSNRRPTKIRGLAYVGTTIERASGAGTVMGTALIAAATLSAHEIRVMALDLLHVAR